MKLSSIKHYMRSTLKVTMVTAITVSISTGVGAREFRIMNSINAAANLPEGARAVDEFKPVPREMVAQAMNTLMETWGTPQMQEYLSQNFYDKDRLEDVIDTLVPDDAKIRILGVQGIQTIQQWEEQVPDDPTREMRVSRVSVVVRTQLEYTDTDGSLATRPGTTEYILKFKEMLGDRS